jgi:hypothetical protein
MGAGARSTETMSEMPTIKTRGRPLRDLTGAKFGRWIVRGRAPKPPGNGHPIWFCDCECGTRGRVVDGNELRSCRSLSCGCIPLERRRTQGGLTKTQRLLYSRWNMAIRRCHDPECPGYEHYGGRGIVVCPGWRNSFVKFFQWAVANGWDPALELDRVDNDGPYSPENCRFTTRRVNSLNRRKTVRLSMGGVTIPLVVAAEAVGLNTATVYNRRKRGWPEGTWLSPAQEGWKEAVR